jgi:AraC-like DNA-binding protein/quercetin dioxygenase-like cupin family protein
MLSRSEDPRLPQGKFYGQTLKQHNAGGFSLSETRYLPGSTLPRHSHESHYLCFVLKGSYRESFERKQRSCEPLMILYHPAGEVHSQTFDKAAVDLFRIEVKPERLSYESHPDLSMEGRDFRSALPISLAHKLYQEFRQPDSVSHLAIEGLGLELIAALARQYRDPSISRAPQRWLTQAHELIQSRFLEHLTLGDIAGTVGVHPVTLAREFRLHYECTVGEMVRRERIAFACRELLKPEKHLADIALSAGFYDQSHFARTFKRLIGMSPALYRASRCPH